MRFPNHFVHAKWKNNHPARAEGLFRAPWAKKEILILWCGFKSTSCMQPEGSRKKYFDFYRNEMGSVVNDVIARMLTELCQDTVDSILLLPWHLPDSYLFKSLLRWGFISIDLKHPGWPSLKQMPENFLENKDDWYIDHITHQVLTHLKIWGWHYTVKESQ